MCSPWYSYLPSTRTDVDFPIKHFLVLAEQCSVYNIGHRLYVLFKWICRAIYDIYEFGISLIGHFLVPKTLTFKNEAKYTAFLLKKSFICMRIKSYFHIKGWALIKPFFDTEARENSEMAVADIKPFNFVLAYFASGGVGRRDIWNFIVFAHVKNREFKTLQKSIIFQVNSVSGVWLGKLWNLTPITRTKPKLFCEKGQSP